MKHLNKSEYAGKTVVLKDSAKHPQFPDFGGSEFHVEDWWDRVYGKSWMDATGNPAATVYAIRGGFNRLPIDNQVLYGKIGMLGCLVHISEIEG